MAGHSTGRHRSDRMRNLLALSASPLVILLGLGACSSEPPPDNQTASADELSARAESARAEPVTAPEPAAAPARRTIALEGLPDLKIGSPAPRAGSWRERGAQIGDGCRTISSPDYPGVYAIVEDGRVRRITVGQGSDVRLVEGVGVGAAARSVATAFPGFREEPHKYVEPPARYYTAPDPAPGAPALRFEIGADDKVSMFHVGVKPTLDYVEGCA